LADISFPKALAKKAQWGMPNLFRELKGGMLKSLNQKLGKNINMTGEIESLKFRGINSTKDSFLVLFIARGEANISIF
jgi:hypothetical protein